MKHIKAYTKSAAVGGAAGGLTQLFIGAVSGIGPVGVLLWLPFAYFSGACAGNYVGRVATEAGAPERGTTISAMSGYVRSQASRASFMVSFVHLPRPT